MKFTPQNGAQEKSFELYKKVRTIDPNDVIINKNKVSWFNFDIKGKISVLIFNFFRIYLKVILTKAEFRRREMPIKQVVLIS